MAECIKCGAFTKFEKGLCYSCFQDKKNNQTFTEPAKALPYNSQLKADTEGERYIKEFFREAGIKYEQQVTIRNLSNDVKAHRVADFYLPKYKVYVEFFGHWNTNEMYKEQYSTKKWVYRQNNIPCVFLYPENLGYINFAFDSRLMETLKENHKESTLIKYKKWKFFKGTKENFWGLVLCILIYLIMLATKEEGKAIVILLFIYNLYKIISIWNLIYVKGSYSISRMLYD